MAARAIDLAMVDMSGPPTSAGHVTACTANHAASSERLNLLPQVSDV